MLWPLRRTIRIVGTRFSFSTFLFLRCRRSGVLGWKREGRARKRFLCANMRPIKANHKERVGESLTGGQTLGGIFRVHDCSRALQAWADRPNFSKVVNQVRAKPRALAPSVPAKVSSKTVRRRAAHVRGLRETTPELPELTRPDIPGSPPGRRAHREARPGTEKGRR